MAIKYASDRPLTSSEEAEIQKMIASDPDNPELTDDEISRLRPLREALPALAANLEKAVAARGRPKADKVKTPVSLRLDPDVIDHYKATGKGWQSRINDDLRKLAGL